MALTDLRRDEGLALLAALAAHIGLVAVLTLRPTPIPLPPPERITVTLSDDVGLTSTSPSSAPAAADEAPELGEEAAPPEPVPVPQSEPLPKPGARATAAPPPKPAPLAKVPPAKAVIPALKALPAKTASKPGASRIGDDFLKGMPGGTAKSPPGPPPATSIGPAVRSALSGAILRQIKPKWQGRVPQGVETEKLVTIISIELDQQGNLIGSPRVLGQEGITGSNRSQAKRHAEEAVKALQLAAPFNLPAEFYEAWRRPPPIRMRKSL